MYLLTEWEGRMGKYLARGQDVRTKNRELRASWLRANILIRELFSFDFPNKLRMGPYRSYDKIIYLSIYIFSGRVAYQSLVCRLGKISKSNYINEKMSVNIKCIKAKTTKLLISLQGMWHHFYHLLSLLCLLERNLNQRPVNWPFCFIAIWKSDICMLLLITYNIAIFCLALLILISV